MVAAPAAVRATVQCRASIRCCTPQTLASHPCMMNRCPCVACCRPCKKTQTTLQWTFKLKRDEHSDFTFCFQDQEQAQQWFDALTQVGRNCPAPTAALQGFENTP